MLHSNNLCIRVTTLVVKKGWMLLATDILNQKYNFSISTVNYYKNAMEIMSLHSAIVAFPALVHSLAEL